MVSVPYRMKKKSENSYVIAQSNLNHTLKLSSPGFLFLLFCFTSSTFGYRMAFGVIFPVQNLRDAQLHTEMACIQLLSCPFLFHSFP